MLEPELTKISWGWGRGDGEIVMKESLHVVECWKHWTHEALPNSTVNHSAVNQMNSIIKSSGIYCQEKNMQITRRNDVEVKIAKKSSYGRREEITRKKLRWQYYSQS